MRLLGQRIELNWEPAQPAAGIQAAASGLDVVGILSIGDIFPPSFVESEDLMSLGRPDPSALCLGSGLGASKTENVSANNGQLLSVITSPRLLAN